jgi:cytochrome c peroxidase
MRSKIFRQAIFLGSWLVFVLTLMSNYKRINNDDTIQTNSLRALYARPISQWPKPNIDEHIVYQEMAALPNDSTWTLVERDAKIKLGQVLFFDPRLSSSDLISCSSCHDPRRAWGDAMRVSSGHNGLQGKRNSPSLLNVGQHKTFFWDGRSGSLEDQAINPISTPHEMNMNTPLLAAKIARIGGYKIYFENAYGDDAVTFDRILEALAAFETIIKSEPSKFDLFVQGNYEALSDAQIRGLDLFRGKARCMNCHHGTYFKDDLFHNTGLAQVGKLFQDLGRYDATRNAKDSGKFRTPSLRDVMRTGPWMHNGLFTDMQDVLKHYMGVADQPSGNHPLNSPTDPILQPLNLSEQERKDIVAFLWGITASPYKMTPPALPE